MLCALACEINVVIPIFMAGETEAEVSWECCAPSSTLTCLVSSVCGDTRPSECMAVRMAASGVRNAVRSHIQASGWPGQEHVGLRILISWIPGKCFLPYLWGTTHLTYFSSFYQNHLANELLGQGEPVATVWVPAALSLVLWPQIGLQFLSPPSMTHSRCWGLLGWGM